MHARGEQAFSGVVPAFRVCSVVSLLKGGIVVTCYQTLLLVSMFSLVALAGCSSVTGPVSVRDSGVLSPESSVPDSGRHDQVALVRPVFPENREKRTVPLLEKLIREANHSLLQRQPDKVVALAERGLRIDRKDSRLYLLLAQAYTQQGNARQAAHFARQGLRYSVRSAPEYGHLQEFLQ